MDVNSRGDITSFRTQFNKLQDSYLMAKCQYYAKWTIPYLMAKPGEDGNQISVEGDFQSAGALLVNSLSSKLTGLLFPSTYPFMDLNLTPEGRMALEQVLEELGDDPLELNNFLANLVTGASAKAFMGKAFFQLVLAFKYLIVTGNVAIKRDVDEGAILCYGLNNYAVRRNGLGKVVEAIIKETVFFGNLPSTVQEFLISKGQYSSNDPTLGDRAVDVFRRITLHQESYYMEQIGVDDTILPDEYSVEYEILKLPYIFPTWALINGEHYGRGLVEELRGDFAKLSQLSEALTLYEVEMMRVVNLVSAEAFDAIDDLAMADTGDYVRCSPNAVVAQETGATNKVQQLIADLEVIWGRLARAMMWQGNTRDGERVTAYEIRQEIQEVESSMGGAYSALAESFQLPLSYLLLYETNEDFMNAVVDLGVGYVGVTTGVNALGKTTKAMNILEVLLQAGQAVEVAMNIDKRIDTTRIVDLFFASRGLDFSEISKSDEQLEQEAQAQAEQAQAEQTMQEGEAMGNMANNMDVGMMGGL